MRLSRVPGAEVGRSKGKKNGSAPGINKSRSRSRSPTKHEIFFPPHAAGTRSREHFSIFTGSRRWGMASFVDHVMGRFRFMLPLGSYLHRNGDTFQSKNFVPVAFPTLNTWYKLGRGTPDASSFLMVLTRKTGRKMWNLWRERDLNVGMPIPSGGDNVITIIGDVYSYFLNICDG